MGPGPATGGEGGGREKKRKKKTPKSSSSALLPRRRAGDQGVMLEYAEDELKEIAGGYSGLWETAPSTNGLGKFIKEKVIREEEIILRSGMPALSLYRGRRCWFDWRKIVIDTYGGWDTHRGGQVCCLLLHTAKSVMKSGLSKRGLVHRLTRR